MLIEIDISFNSNFVQGFQFRADMAELRDKFTFPTVQNLMGAVEGLNRLRETYLLDPSKMADGELLGHCCATRLTCNCS